MRAQRIAGLCILGAILLFAQDWTTATSLPSVDLAGLTPAQSAKVLKLLRASNCTCNCGMKMAECRMKDPSCSYSKGMAATIVDAIKHGKSETEAMAAAAASQWGKGPADHSKPLEDPVAIPVENAPVRGVGTARVTLVEFSDFQCPFCQKVDLTVKQLLRKYDGRVKVAYRDFPLLEIHPHAAMAAEASRCAGEQGKFWEYHDALFENQSKLDEGSLAERAVSLELNEKLFHDCLANRKFKDQVEADLQEGRKVGIAGTPSFFINGIFLNGSQALTEFEKIIDAQLAMSGQQNASLNLGAN